MTEHTVSLARFALSYYSLASADNISLFIRSSCLIRLASSVSRSQHCHCPKLNVHSFHRPETAIWLCIMHNPVHSSCQRMCWRMFAHLRGDDR